MATPTYIALATVTLASSATSVVFSSIPSGYRDLILQGQSASATNVNVNIKLNSDSTTTNYYAVTMYGESSTAGSTYNNDGRIVSTGSTVYPFQIQIMDYSATDKHKTILSRSGATDIVRAFAVRWANTNAINTVELYNSTFASGSTFSLYGIEA